jgi:hypothetical protein
MANTRIEEITNQVSAAAEAMGVDIEGVIECLQEATRGMVNMSDDEEKTDDRGDGLGVTLGSEEANEALNRKKAAVESGDESADYYADDFENYSDDDFERDSGGSQNDGYSTEDSDFARFGKKIVSKATESVRQIAKKKGIYIVGRKGKKFLGIRFTKKGNYSKNKKGRPNGKMYTYDGLKKMKNKRVSFKKLPELIDMMNTKAVLKKYKNFKFGFELKKQPRGCRSFGYTFPVGAGYGKRSALLYGKL